MMMLNDYTLNDEVKVYIACVKCDIQERHQWQDIELMHDF